MSDETKPPKKLPREHPGLMIGGVVVLEKNEQISAEEFGRRVAKASADFLEKRKSGKE